MLRLSLILAILACVSGPVYPDQLPEIPQIDFDRFAPPIAEQVRVALDKVRSDPGDAEANGQLGMVLHVYEELDSALACYARARSLQPDDFRWTYYSSLVLAALGRHEEASAMLRSALAQRPDYLPARLLLAESLFSAGSLEESLTLYQEIGRDHPASAQAHYGEGRARMSLGDAGAAVKNLARACELFPRYGAAHYALAQAYRSVGNTEKTREHLGLYQKHRHDRPPADDALLQEVRRFEQGALSHLRRGVDLEADGRILEAVEEHERALEIDPEFEQAHINLMTLYGRLGRTDRVEKHYEAITAINPNLQESHYNYGVHLTGQEKLAEAAAAFRRALDINPHYAEAHGNLAYLLMIEGKLDEAERHYRAALENKPNYRLAHFNLGKILVHNGKLTEAIEHLRKTLSPEDEDTPSYTYALGAAYARAGDRERALQYLRAARDKASSLGQEELVRSIDRDLRLLQERPPRQ